MNAAQEFPIGSVPAERHLGSARWRGIHATTMIAVYLVLLVVIPSSATITALGSLGRPSLLWGLVMFGWWVIARLQVRVFDVRSVWQPVRSAYVLLIVVALVSFGVALLRGQPADQVSPAFTALVRLLSWAGVLLVTLDGVRTMRDMGRLVRRIGILAGFLSALGLAQFVTRSLLIDVISAVPGISLAADGVAQRGGVARVAGTAIHPLEYATALNAALPLVVALAISGGLRGRPTRAGYLWWIPVALISLSAALGVSRSAIIGFGVAVLLMIPALPRRYRGGVILGGAFLMAIAVVAVPGLLNTTLTLFTGAGSDPSTQSRTGGLDRAPEFISASPIVGAGFGTFLPRYYIFDNAWVLMTVELGLLGLIAFAAIFVSAIWSAFGARLQSTDPDTRLLGYAFSASVVNIALLFAFFDGLAFPISGGMFVVIVGLCGVLRTITAGDRRPRRDRASGPAPEWNGSSPLSGPKSQADQSTEQGHV